MVVYLDDERIFVKRGDWYVLSWMYQLPGERWRCGILRDRASRERYCIYAGIFDDLQPDVKDLSLKKIKKFVTMLREKNFPEFLGILEDNDLNVQNDGIKISRFGVFPVFNYVENFDYRAVARYLKDLAYPPLKPTSFFGFPLEVPQEFKVYEEVVTFDAVGFRQMYERIDEDTLIFLIDLSPLRNFTESDWEQFCFGLYYFGAYATYFSIVKNRAEPPIYLKLYIKDPRSEEEYKELFDDMHRLEAFFADFVSSLLWYCEEEALQIAHEELQSNRWLSEIIGTLREETALRKFRH